MTFFGHPEGKSSFISKLKEFVPEHKAYFEPFCGSAAMLLHKEPVEFEMISDLNPLMIRYLRTLRDLRPEDVDKLRKLKWTFESKEEATEYFKRNRKAPKDPIKFIHWFRLLAPLTWGSIGVLNVDKNGILTDQFFSHLKNRSIATIDVDRFIRDIKEVFIPRLKNVRIIRADAIEVIRKFKDRRDAFWFLDPPYPEPAERSGGEMEELMDKLDWDKFVDLLPKIRGKLLMTLNRKSLTMKEDWLKDFQVHSVKLRSKLQDGHPVREELFITNYEVKKGIRVPQTREEAQREMERIMGDYYMVEENGQIHPAIVEYHARGIWYSEEIPKVKEDIEAVLDDPEKLEKVIKQPHINAWYLLDDLEEVKKDAQKADDERKDVSAAVRKHFTQDGKKIMEAGANIANFYNIGNVHIDFRALHPSNQFLVAWTFDIPKVVLQDLSNYLTFVIRDRFFDWKPGDQFLAQKKLPVPLYYLTHSVPGSSGVELRPTGEPGAGRGATRETAGRFILQTWVEVVYGVSKSDYHELWLFNLTDHGKEVILKFTPSDLKAKVKKAFNNLRKVKEGRWDVKLVPLLGVKPALLPDEQAVRTARIESTKPIWMVSKPWKTDKPYILTHDKKKEEEKAKRDKIELIWNEQAIKVLQERYGVKFGKPFQKLVKIAKVNRKLHVVEGPVLTPYKIDHQGDIILPEEIDKAAIMYAEKFGYANEMHKGGIVNAKLVKNFVFVKPVKIGDKTYPAGTWWVGFKIYDKDVWDKIEKGIYRAFSIEGRANRRRVLVRFKDRQALESRVARR